MAEADESSGNSQGGDYEAAQSVQTETESYSQTSWMTIVFLALWLFFAGLCVVAVRRRRSMISQQLHEPSLSRELQDEERPSGAPTADGQSLKTKHGIFHSSSSSYVLPLALAVAFSLSVFTQTTCAYFEVTVEKEFLSIGIWSVSVPYDGNLGGEGICYSTFKKDDFEVDASMVVARVAGILASVIGGLFLLIVAVDLASFGPDTVSQLLYKGSATFGALLLIAGVCQSLTLLVGATDQCDSSLCHIDAGALSAITAAAYWILCAFCVAPL
mmetsp:Transcript_12214/g.15971  ORF Transcript_12214/g.15971 Transcript_12214/m.15971 type:complete len:272 (-) Transcript_12214:114-929(-)|eukprot:CAMPEP_0198143868 /NCGR_PEP_ID=MMETSP1443-20131203/11172_1 /TAXON_ID=186043 /ORGANISM="Entomoneis sp., Strain CCMP2396" /LENGTH=271 /DNA_ID=CAMNT_0043807167 /DNA_START=70 /DNA_END=885 /DNA_ORIENTATION=-